LTLRSKPKAAGLILRLYEQETASRESEEIGFGNSPINVWVRNADCEPVHCLPGVDRTIGRSRAMTGRDILLMQGSQLMLGWLVIATIANRPWSLVKWQGVLCRSVHHLDHRGLVLFPERSFVDGNCRRRRRGRVGFVRKDE
jgi:hypothetical protein